MKKDLPLFSVMIANHNNGDYLMDAIESMKTQTYTNWEIIIVDDCSTDKSFELYLELEKDPRIRVFCNEENKGCGFAKRRCLEEAKGEICGFLDADDCLAENALELMVKAHQTHPECSLIYSQMYYVDPQLKIIAVSEHQRALYPGESFLTCHKPLVISHFVTLKKSFYDRTEGMNASLRIAEDVDLYFKLEEVGDTLFLPEPLYYYRINTGNNVSLVAPNRGKTLGWEVLARAAACKRRGLPIEDHTFNILEKAIEDIKESAFQQGYEMGHQKGQETIRSTKAYRIGKKITRLFPKKSKRK